MQKLSIALQKSGRLAEGCIALFQKCGIKIKPAKGQLFLQDEEFGIDFIFVRDDDIPGLIENNICDLGIFGENLLDEYGAESMNMVMKLGFAKCRLSLAYSRTQKYVDVQDLNNKTIATSYPNILGRFLKANNVNAKAVVMHGSVELAPQIGIADVICDLVSSGATLRENGLQEWITIHQSQAVLMSALNPLSAEKQQKLDRLLLRMKSVLQAEQSRYIMLHLDRSQLPELVKILPGSDAPTVLDLQGRPDKVAVHVVSVEEVFWDTIEKLKSIGADSILVLPIEKMVP